MDEKTTGRVKPLLENQSVTEEPERATDHKGLSKVDSHRSVETADGARQEYRINS